MRHVCCAGIIAVAMITSAGPVRGQAVSLQEQLVAQYQIAKVTADSAGFGIVAPGTLLTIQKSGVLAVPWRALALCPAKYQDNAFHASVGFCAGMLKDVSRYFQIGEKVYPTKIDVNVNKAKVSFTVVACDSCSGTNPATSMKGEVVFQFAKGYLEKAGVGEVEDAIGKVFLIAEDSQQNDNQNQGNGSGQQAPQPQETQPQQQSEPATVQLGMTTDQVQSILGKPQKIFNVGAKQIYVYPDVKVTFQNGKVADVQ
jgi:hypothetical protein